MQFKDTESSLIAEKIKSIENDPPGEALAELLEMVLGRWYTSLCDELADRAYERPDFDPDDLKVVHEIVCQHYEHSTPREKYMTLLASEVELHLRAERAEQLHIRCTTALTIHVSEWIKLRLRLGELMKQKIRGGPPR